MLVRRTRWALLFASALAVAAVGAAAGAGLLPGTGGAGAEGGGAAGRSTTTEGREAPTSVLRSAGPTTTAPPTTTAAPPTTVAPTPPPDDGILRRGSSGDEVRLLQQRLTDLRLDPGPVDGRFGLGTFYAVQAFQKLAGQSPDGAVGDQVRTALAAPPALAPLVPSGGAGRVEIDLERQLLFLYEGGALALVTHVSTGSGERYCVDGRCSVARTPVGSHRFSWRYPGWRQSRLGRLYNPVYFTATGIAVHGSNSVPTRPASHGCVRIPMHIAEYFPSLVDSGDPVYVIAGSGAVPPAPPAVPAPIPPPPDPPAPPETAAPTTTAAPPTTTTTVPPTTTNAAPPTTTT